MSLQTEKIKLAHTVLELESENIIRHVNAILSAYKTDLWDELSDLQKKSINKARKQIGSGQFKSTKDVLRKHTQWLSK